MLTIFSAESSLYIRIFKMNIKVIRSNRKTIGLSMTAEGLLVRAPRWTSDREIEKVIKSHEAWIEKAAEKVKKREELASEAGFFSEEELKELTEKARKVIPERVAFYAPKVGVTYGRITIRTQKTRWGSCTAKGNLNFNCLLMLCPDEVVDSVVVHELCHRKEMNHSERFCREVYRVMPEYEKYHKWLKKYGNEIMRRVKP